MIVLRNVRKGFGDVRVLNGASSRLEKCFIYTLKGGNGSEILPFSTNQTGIGRKFQDLRLIDKTITEIGKNNRQEIIQSVKLFTERSIM
jgi:hypothetical protein